MKLLDAIKIAIFSLRINKTRSFLAMLGIIIGIASVIIMVSIGNGAKNLIVRQIVSFGSNNIFIEPGPWSKRMERGQLLQSALEESKIKTLTLKDAEAIEKLPSVEMVAPFVVGVDRVIYKDTNKKITFMGSTPSAGEIMGVEVVRGRNMTEQEIKAMARVAVLGYKTAADLFGEEDPIGKTIRIKKTNLRVIGVLEKGGMQMFMNLDEIVYVPVTTAQKVLLGIDYIRWIIAKAKNEEAVNEAIRDIRLLLRERHGIYNPEENLSKDDFKVISQEETAEMLGAVTGVLTAFLSVVAAISLVVGGIGIMNVMLVSVTERTREVGLRKAVGAQKRDILCQFLLESITLTILGGAGGILLGIVGSFLGGIAIGYFLNLEWDFVLPSIGILTAFGVSTVIGLIFGIYPAHKASQLNPIDALRYE